MGGRSMELTDRKKQILRAIVDSYIRTAEPVGSKTISQMPGCRGGTRAAGSAGA